MIVPRLRISISTLNTLNFRYLHTGIANRSAETSPLFKLRQRTGIAYSLCREALNKHNDDIDQAEAWLKAQALALGLQKATKVRGRNTREGLVGLALHPNSKNVTVVELNCETDFVSKNEIFRDLTLDLTYQIASMGDVCDREKLVDTDSVQKMILNESQIHVLDNQIVPAINKLGENIRIQKAIHFQAIKESVQIFGQIHSKSGHRTVDNLELISGRFGALVALDNLGDPCRSLKAFGNRLSQHVIGYSPTYIELPDNIRKHLEDAAKETKREESEADGNRQDTGYNSDLEGQEERNACDEWPSMMDQRVIMSDSQSVRDFCKENEVSIVYFNRFECGSD